ncbi:ANR family transcriptional regulator, partial [Raoultella sp. C349492]|uniref:ANR family transcriptional regulator n=1 Tax=Raoultella sp. C349492 TaxID=2970253 RepID=UPI0035C6FC88
VIGGDVKTVSALLSYGIKSGWIETSWRGNKRTYRYIGKDSAISVPIANIDIYELGVKPTDDFKSLSERACQLERSNELVNAGQVWLVAAELAKNPINSDWCRARAAFCSISRKVPEVAE